MKGTGARAGAVRPANPRRADVEVMALAYVLVLLAVLCHHAWGGSLGSPPAPVLATGLLVGTWVTQLVQVPVGLHRGRNVQLISAVNAMLLPAAVLLPPVWFVVVGVLACLPRIGMPGAARLHGECHIRILAMSAASIAFDVIVHRGPDTAIAWTTDALAGLVVAGFVMLVVQSVAQARYLQLHEGMLPGDVPVLVAADLVRDSPDVALGALVCVLLAQPATLVLLIPMFLLKDQFLRARGAALTAYRDPKTGLLTLAAFRDLAGMELSRARRYNRPVAALMIDLDGLKTVNTAYGHLAGDRFIEAMAGVLVSTCRRHDLVSRFGGDEFCVLLPDTGMTEAALVAERIRAVAHGTVIPGVDAPMTLCASIGVTVALADEGIESLLERTDEGLLRAKAQGRDRVTLVEPVA